jgi:sulfur-carrier protein
MVRIELFGVPRLRAGRDAVDVEADDVASALVALASACPELAPAVVGPEGLSPAYQVALNGVQFTDDPATPVVDGDVLLIVSAQAGG